ncbi:MAG: hypothetical protein IT372_34760 [Polyangiaceae bacterium]|nr:hypothetical protein [Polyangiaceae bacterium]
MSQEDKDLLAKVKAKEKERAELQAAPSKFIAGGRWKGFDKGIINTYTRATAIEFTNSSQFDVADPEGKITYIDKNGAEMATVPFRAKGEVRARSSVELEVVAGEISGGAARARVVVERVHIRG